MIFFIEKILSLAMPYMFHLAIETESDIEPGNFAVKKSHKMVSPSQRYMSKTVYNKLVTD